MKKRADIRFLYLNIGFIDHLFILIFATLLTLRMADQWGIGCELLYPMRRQGLSRSGVRYSRWRVSDR